MRLLVAMACLFATIQYTAEARADQIAPAWTMVVGCSSGGRYYLRLIPDSEPVFPPVMATGIVYKVERESPDTELWRVRVPWSYVYLSADGAYMAWISHDPKYENIVELYHRDQLIRGYSVGELLEEKPRVTVGGSLLWRGAAYMPHFVGGKNEFQFVTSEGIEYFLDATDGHVITRRPYEAPCNDLPGEY